jgi:ubiquinone/menaquinone biosynthesis C-methylase UbiE
MVSVDVRFSGSVPANYEQYLVPLLFRPYAEELVARAREWGPKRILETACGTGVVTALLASAFPEAEIVATDLNQAMIDVAQTRVASPNVAFRQADALDLPFADGSFDLIVCQFGVMFYPDKVQGNREARRLLSDGGHYLLAIWDRIERNTLSNLAYQAMAEIFPDNPPKFMTRGPFSYYEPEWIEAHLEEAGFEDINIETVEHLSRSPSAADAARGLVYGSPMGVELADYGPNALDLVFERLSQSAARYENGEGFAAPMVAHIVTARR